MIRHPPSHELPLLLPSFLRPRGPSPSPICPMTPIRLLSGMHSLSKTMLSKLKQCMPSLTWKSKGYGFFKFTLEIEPAVLLDKLSDELLDGRNIRVHYANHG